MNGRCANRGLSQPRGSTSEELRVCQLQFVLTKGSPQNSVTTLVPTTKAYRVRLSITTLPETLPDITSAVLRQS
jgi:hypothetical protein